MKKTITLFCFLLSMLPIAIGTAFSQNADIDSMLQKITAEKDESRRIDIIYISLVIIGETNPVLGLKYAQKLLDYSQINKDKIGEAYVYHIWVKCMESRAIWKKVWDML